MDPCSGFGHWQRSTDSALQLYSFIVIQIGALIDSEQAVPFPREDQHEVMRPKSTEIPGDPGSSGWYHESAGILATCAHVLVERVEPVRTIRIHPILGAAMLGPVPGAPALHGIHLGSWLASLVVLFFPHPRVHDPKLLELEEEVVDLAAELVLGPVEGSASLPEKVVADNDHEAEADEEVQANGRHGPSEEADEQGLALPGKKE